MASFLSDNNDLEYKFGLINVGWKPFGSDFYTIKRRTYNVIHIEILKNEANNESKMTTVYFEITDCLKN